MMEDVKNGAPKGAFFYSVNVEMLFKGVVGLFEKSLVKLCVLVP